MRNFWSSKIENIQKISFCGRDIWLLRDDLIGGEFNGNKARKLEYFLKADLRGVKRIVSHGSSQSNAMYSLSVFAKMKNLEFCYVVSHLNSNLAANPIGNLKFALENGMKIFVAEDRRAFANKLASGADALFIEEGVAMSEAEEGFKTQAREIEAWAQSMGFIAAECGQNFSRASELNLRHLNKNASAEIENDRDLSSCLANEACSDDVQNLCGEQDLRIQASDYQAFFGDDKELNLNTNGELNLQDISPNPSNATENKKPKILDVFLPSGTGTSAAYLAKNTKFSVYTCPCVGDAQYLKSQIYALDPNSKVQILPPPKKYHFGDLKPELYEIWRRMLESTGVEFDLIYDPVGLLTLEANLDKFPNEILYIHQGGVLGNISQKLRYERKFKDRI